MPTYQDFPWRVGRSAGRTIYAVTGPEATKSDVLIGVMDNRALAAEAVEAHNRNLGTLPPLTEEEQKARVVAVHQARQNQALS